jgi:hypothetical protein
MNSKIQGVCARTVVGVGVVVGVFSCGNVFVAMPEIALARCLGIGVVGAVLNSDVQGKISVAVAKAKDETAAQKEAEFLYREKQPLRTFVGPDDYGQLTFQYPKTWSVYVDSDGTNNSDFVAYFHPAQVDPVKDENSRYSLRFSILNQQITTVQAEYDDRLEDGSLTSSVFNADNNKISGTKFVGKINENIQSIQSAEKDSK